MLFVPCDNYFTFTVKYIYRYDIKETKAKGEDKMQIDPICGMQVDENTAQYKTEYKGTTYYFCAPGCKKAFESEPEKYLKSEPAGMGEKKPWWKFW
jgi:YHS domain-containing protein